MSVDKTNPPYYDGDACMRKIARVTQYMTGAEAFNVGQGMKYVWRAGRKDGESGPDDLDKASWYLNWLDEHGDPSSAGQEIARQLRKIIGYCAPECLRERIMELPEPGPPSVVGNGGYSFEGETGYLDLLRSVLDYGELRPNRTGVDTRALFGVRLEFDLTRCFPIFTTKKVWWKGVAVELDWMLQGKTDVAYLQEHGVGIWNQWAKADYRPEMGYAEGELGPVYGAQWRNWQTAIPSMARPPEFDPPLRPAKGIDQIAQIVDKLRNHRDDRRILLSAWNVAEIDRMKLPPCHYAAQFLVDGDDALTTIVSIRSWDLFLGAPFNVSQYALLTHVLAHVAGLRPKRLILNAGDAHVYTNHTDAVREQLQRTPHDRPQVTIDAAVEEIDDFRFHHAILTDYEPQAAIKGEVAV